MIHRRAIVRLALLCVAAALLAAAPLQAAEAPWCPPGTALTPPAGEILPGHDGCEAPEQTEDGQDGADQAALPPESATAEPETATAGVGAASGSQATPVDEQPPPPPAQPGDAPLLAPAPAGVPGQAQAPSLGANRVPSLVPHDFGALAPQVAAPQVAAPDVAPPALRGPRPRITPPTAAGRSTGPTASGMGDSLLQVSQIAVTPARPSWPAAAGAALVLLVVLAEALVGLARRRQPA